MNLSGKSSPPRHRLGIIADLKGVRAAGREGAEWKLEKQWKSSCLVNGPLIPSPDRRQWQPGGGSGHQLAWIDTFLSRLQLSLLRASTDCNISFFPPKLEVSTAILLSLGGGRAALCLFTRRWIENIVPKSFRITKLFSIAYKTQNLRTCLKMTGWLAVVISGCVGLIFSCDHQWVHSSIQDRLKQ